MQRTARRRIVSAGSGPFHNEPINSPAGLAGKRDGQGRGSNNAKKIRTLELRGIAGTKNPGVEGSVELLSGECALNINFQFRALSFRQTIEHAGNGSRNARTHEDVIHTSEHGAK